MKRYIIQLEVIKEAKEVTVFSDFAIHTDGKIKINSPEIVIKDSKKKRYLLIVMLLPTDIISTFNDVMVIVVRNGHGDTSSNSGRGWLHFT